MGDHGALLLLADYEHPTDTILYSWDEGLQWQELRIYNEKIMIKNIIIEPTNTSQHFLVYGETLHKKGKKTGVMIGLNFASLQQAQCRNPEEPGSVNSDYEKWAPSDGKENHLCLMGKKTLYVRKKRESACFNGMAFELKVDVMNCQCTDEDYECDEGFYRSASTEPCTPIDSSTHKLPIEGEIHRPPADCRGFYSISKGYRKIPDNSCIQGVKYDPIIISCPYSWIYSIIGFLLFGIILVILFFLVYLAFNKSFFSGLTEFVKGKMQGSNRDLISDQIYKDLVCNYFISLGCSHGRRG